MNKLKDRAKQARKLSGFNQPEAAKEIGITQPSLSDIETGKTSKIEATTLLGMVKAYQIDPFWLLYGLKTKGVKENVGIYNAGNFYQGKYKNIINAANNNELDQIDKQILDALNDKYTLNT